jgi:hypothetical protein
MAASNDLGLSSYSAKQPFWQLSVYAKHLDLGVNRPNRVPTARAIC